MVGALRQVPPGTRRLLTFAIIAALAALTASAVIVDEETEFGTPTDHFFSIIMGINLGPVLMIAGVAALFLAARPHDRRLVPVALIAILFGAFMSWLFFVETTELPDFWPY